ncbi:MAG: tetraacyldisaccharide 4'-kinase [Gemmatimonadaceae bacterium]|nr:tetraacyldisaccharide 4'-kinase [Gemmatimonadaceae bacterium]
MAERTLVDSIWWGAGAGARFARMLLVPFSTIFAMIVTVRNALYDRGALLSRVPRLPAISVGNLTVGGTGKTPVSSWLAMQLQARGMRPSIVLRGYGDDEPLVHARLTPSIPVFVNANRLEAIERAAAAGADVAVLDDAFQHRRVARAADVVLVSADVADSSERPLPAGPYREPSTSLARASLVVVTRKSASTERARTVAERARAVAPAVPVAIMHLALDTVHFEGLPTASLASIAGRHVLAIAGIGNGAAFGAQLREAGATVRMRAYPDHHPFTAADARALARDLAPIEIALCTLKDAVKLLPLWPREAAPLGYVSQAVIVEEGGDAINAILDLVINASPRQL